MPAPASLADGPVRAGLIVVTSFAPDACWRPSQRSCAEGALTLLQNTVSARTRPAPAMSATSAVARDAVILVGRRGEAADVAPALIEAALLRSAPSNTVSA